MFSIQSAAKIIMDLKSALCAPLTPSDVESARLLLALHERVAPIATSAQAIKIAQLKAELGAKLDALTTPESSRCAASSCEGVLEAGQHQCSWCGTWREE